MRNSFTRANFKYENSHGFTGIEVLVVLAFIGMVGGGTVVASDGARPGDALFSIDLAMERLQERFVDENNPVRKLEF